MTLQLHYFPTLNGHKVTIALAEMGLPYDLVMVNLMEEGQNRPEFRAINPNGRIPALVDPDAAGGPVAVFESAAILQYLGRKTGQFYPADEQTRAEIDSWLFWQMAGLGPMSGQVNWFTRAQKPERDLAETEFAIHRFRKETERLFVVLEDRLQARDHVCGDYSIADMCIWPWIDKYPDNGGGLAAFPAVAAWHARIGARPAVRPALEVGLEQLNISPEVRARWMQKG